MPIKPIRAGDQHRRRLVALIVAALVAMVTGCGGGASISSAESGASSTSSAESGRSGHGSTVWLRNETANDLTVHICVGGMACVYAVTVPAWREGTCSAAPFDLEEESGYLAGLWWEGASPEHWEVFRIDGAPSDNYYVRFAMKPDHSGTPFVELADFTREVPPPSAPGCAAYVIPSS